MVTDAIVTVRAQIGPGVWLVAGTSDPGAETTIAVRTAFSKVIAAIATYKENPGDVRPIYYAVGSGATVDEVTFTVIANMEISFVIIGLQ